MSAIPPDSLNPNISVRDIPRHLMKGTGVDWRKVQLALNITSDEELKVALLYAYRLDWRVQHYVNDVLLRLAVPALVTKSPLPPTPPTDEEAAWLSADTFCEQCPGSEYIDYGGDFVYPRCGNNDRPERYSDCIKYRQNLSESQLKPEEVQVAFDIIVQELEELHDDYFPKGQAEQSGRLGPNVRNDRNLAATWIKSLVATDARAGKEEEANPGGDG